MANCLVITGVLLIGIALVAFIGAIVFVFMARKRSAATGTRPAAVTPAAPQASPRPDSAPAPGQPSPAPLPAAVDPNATVAVPLYALRAHGRIVFTTGPLAGASYDVTPEGFWVGRSEPAQVVIPLASISKQHVWFGVRDERVVAVDQASTNGTFVNGTRLKGQQPLSPGDEITLADNVAIAHFVTD